MPELPEVEAARRAIEEHCTGKVIKRAVIANDSKVIDGVSAVDFEASLVGKTLVAALRKGKNMWLQLDSPPFPSFQFGMAGAIYIKGVAITKYKRSSVSETDEWPSKYSKVFIELDDGLELSFTDKRRFAKVRLLEDPPSQTPICELGPDALLEPMTVDELADSLSKKKIGIKALLLDQSFISGIGNWIADEVLYQAKIHPLQIASSLSKESSAALHKSIKEVIEKAVEVGADSCQFPSNWIFHSREKKPGKALVDGRKIEFITAGGRTTAYVPALQKLSGTQAVTAPSKLKGSTKKNYDGKSDDSKDDELESDKDEDAVNVTKLRKTAKRRGKKLSKRRNSEGDRNNSGDLDNDSDDGNKQTDKNPPKRKPRRNDKKDEGNQEKRTTGKNLLAKRKSTASDDDQDNISVGSDGNNENRKTVRKGKPKQAKATKQEVKGSQSVKRTRKR